jgi:hypothetical protein
LAFVADTIEDREQSLGRILVQYTVRGLQGKTWKPVRYVWGNCAGKLRWDEDFSPDPNRVRRVVWNNSVGHSVFMYHDKDRLRLLSSDITSDPRDLSESYHYLYLTGLHIGSEALSTAIRTRGVSATHEGVTWIINLGSRPGYPNSREEAVIRSDRNYLVERLTLYDPAGQRLSDMRVNDWMVDPEYHFLPGKVTWWNKKTGTDYAILTVQKIIYGKNVADGMFSVPDDGKVPMYDYRSRRFIRAPQRHVVPITQARMETSYRTLFSLSTRADTTKAFYDNRSRPIGNCGLQCVWMICRILGKKVNWDELARKHSNPDGQNSMLELIDIAHSYGVELEGLQVPFEQLAHLPTPCIVYAQPGGQPHFYVVARIENGAETIFWPPAQVTKGPINRITPRIWGRGYILALKD